MIRDPRVRWPDGLLPEACPVFAHDELEADVSPAAFWARLVRATRWHEDYDNCKRLVIDGGGDQLALGTRFTWTTFHVRVTTVVDNFEPERYLSWTGHGLGSRGHHVWLIEPTPRGCRIVTEEARPALRPACSPRSCGVASATSTRAGWPAWPARRPGKRPANDHRAGGPHRAATSSCGFDVLANDPRMAGGNP